MEKIFLDEKFPLFIILICFVFALVTCASIAFLFIASGNNKKRILRDAGTLNEILIEKVERLQRLLIRSTQEREAIHDQYIESVNELLNATPPELLVDMQISQSWIDACTRISNLLQNNTRSISAGHSFYLNNLHLPIRELLNMYFAFVREFYEINISYHVSVRESLPRHVKVEIYDILQRIVVTSAINTNYFATISLIGNKLKISYEGVGSNQIAKNIFNDWFKTRNNDVQIATNNIVVVLSLEVAESSLR